MVVFGAVSAGQRQLWLRPLASDEAHVLADTAGASYPFWSPDSKSIAFFADDKLKKIDISGGGAVVICDARDARGGWWSSNGTILFGGRNGPIFRTTENGATPAAVTKPVAGDVSHRWPVVLPDGEHFLYTIERGQEAGMICAGVLAGSNAGDMRVRLIDAPSQAALVGDSIVFVRDHVLMAQRFDSRAIRMVGPAVVLPEQHVTFYSPQVRAVFSAAPDGTLVYQGGDGAERGQMVRFSRTGQQMAAVTDVGDYGAMNVAPDGNRLVVVDVSTRPRSLWLFDFVRGVKSHLITAGGNQPVWSPDGTQIAYAAGFIGGRHIAIHDLRTGTDRHFPKFGTDDQPSSWSRDGRNLFFIIRSTAASGSDLWYYSFADGAAHPYVTTPADESYVQVSPDGKWVAYMSSETHRFETYLAPFPPTGARWQISTDGGMAPQWRSDGKELCFLDSEGNEVAVPITLGGEPVFGHPQRLFNLHAIGALGPPTLAPDGTFLIKKAGADQLPAAESLTLVDHLDVEIAAAEQRR